MRWWIDELEGRTQAFAVAVTRIAGRWERSFALRDHARQLVRAAGSVSANHRAMRRARSMREFIAKAQIVNEECDECVLWLELLLAAGGDSDEPRRLLAEARELRAIFAKAKQTARKKWVNA